MIFFIMNSQSGRSTRSRKSGIHTHILLILLFASYKTVRTAGRLKTLFYNLFGTINNCQNERRRFINKKNL